MIIYIRDSRLNRPESVSLALLARQLRVPTLQRLQYVTIYVNTQQYKWSINFLDMLILVKV